jgi:SARP family transcriptional regulator, regulator of embCAB operon
MQFHILGPLRVFDGDEPVPLPGPRRRALLIALLANANTVVPTNKLVDWLWQCDPPRSALTTLHAHLSNLRRTLEPHRERWTPSSRLITQSPGYLIRVEPGELDVMRFERLVAEGTRALGGGDMERARAVLTEALALWRGPALSDVAHLDAARGEIARLSEFRLTAATLRIEADLALRRHLEVVPELTGLIAAHPLHERFYVQLMVALTRSGRRADALAVYLRARSVLAEELAVAPGPALRCAQAAILADEAD